MKEGLTMPGSRVRETHAATVLSIVGRELALPVQTRGTGFSMTGPFGWRAVASRFARGERDPIALARATMDGARIAPSINIAECGEEVSRRTYLAMIGGVSHEAFHRLYTQQGVLTPETIGAAIAPALANPTIDWAKRSKLVLDLQNVVEDIMIERLGCAEFPGVVTKMHDLADYIVRMEGESRAKAGNPPTTVASAVFVTWRDRGLGYNTPTIRDNLARIASECPQGVGMLRPGGVLHDLFVRSVPDVSTPEAREAAKRALLDGVSLRIALEAVAHLEATSEGGEGEGGKPEKGKPEKGDGPSPGKPEKGDGPRPDGPSPGKPEKGKPEKGDGEPGDGESGDGEPGDGESGDGESGDGEPSDGEPSDGESGDGEPSNGAGGGEGSSSVTAKDFLDSHDTGGKQSLDSNSALEAGVKSDRDDAPITDYDAPRPYRPFSTAEDETVQVRATRENAGSFANIVKECRKGTAYLRTRLAVIFRALENSGTEHGVRKGSALSPRTLVDSFCEMKGGTMPTRAYMDRTPAMDMSIAASVVIDESSSMRSKLRETCALTYTLMDALDAIGAKSMAVGFRAKRFCQDVSYGETSTGCHRTHAMHYDLFKSWGESFKVAAPRLREIRAEGGTPMADGVEFALNELSSRPEGHRILFVVTDGEPDYGHGQVLKSQLVRAASAGVLVVGVGLGHESAHVKTTFPDHVYSDELDALPALLVRKLEELVRTRATGAKRGRAVRAA